MRAIAKVVLLSITLWIVISSHGHAQSVIQTDAVGVTSYELQSQKRVGRFDFEYTYNVTFTNTGETLAGVQGLVISNNPSVTLLTGQADIGDMAASSQVTATIGIQHSRRARFSQSNLEWTFTAEVANQAPTITLIGDNPLFIQVGEQYTDPGANGLDAEDGVLPVEIDDSAVNTADAGEYLVSFNVTDSNGLAAETVFRTVIVEQSEVQVTNRILIHKVGKGELIAAQPEKITCFDNNICEVFLSQGESIDLEAIAESGFTFDGYRSCEQSSGNMCTLTYDSGKAVIASFVQELVLEDNVIQLNEQQIALLQNYTQGTNELVFSSFVDSTGFDVGNILVADYYTNFPNDIVVFAERIVDIKIDTDGTLRLRVVPATLDDVVKVGSFTQADIEARIGGAAAPSVQSLVAVMPSGERIPMTRQKSASIESSNPNNIRVLDEAVYTVTVFDNNTLDENDDIVIVFTLTVDGAPFLGLGFDRFSINEVIFTYEVELDVNVAFIAKAGFNIDSFEKPEYFSLDLPCYPVSLGICLFPVFKFNPTASFDIGTALSASGTLNLIGTGGIHYLDGKTTPIFNLEPSMSSNLEPLSGIKARVQGGLKATFATFLNGIVGPEIGVEPYVALNSDITLSPTCPVNVYSEVGLKATAGGRINFINVGFEITLAEWKKLFELDEACTVPTQPGKPNIVTLVNNGTNIRLSWEDFDNSFTDVTYSVFRTTDSSRTLLNDGLLGSSYIDPIVFSSLEYCYIVVATNSAGLSAESREKCAAFVGGNFIPPTMPSNFAVDTQDNVTFRFSWDPSTDDIDDSASISYSLFESDINTGQIYFLQNTQDTSISIVPNRNAQSCYFVVAIDSDANSSGATDAICIDSNSPGPGGIDPPTEFETIELDARIDGNLDNVTSIAWYQFELPDDGTIRITRAPRGAPFDMTIYAENTDGSLTQLNKFRETDSGGVFRTIDVASGRGPGKYYIKFDESASQSVYRFRVGFLGVSVPNDPEPNNTVNDAANLALEESMTGRIGYTSLDVRDDTDWFKFELPDDGTIRITRAPRGSPFDMTIYAENSDGSLMELSKFRETDSGGVFRPIDVATGRGPGTYYIKLDNSDSQSIYRFRLSLLGASVPSDPEPNNTVNNAVNLALEESMTGRLGYTSLDVRDDTDWFKFELPDDGTIRVTRAPGGADFDMTIYAENTDGSLMELSKFRETDSGGVFRPIDVATGRGPGTYYIKFDQSASQSFYRFRVSL
jgi:hypothetical protein